MSFFVRKSKFFAMKAEYSVYEIFIEGVLVLKLW